MKFQVEIINVQSSTKPAKNGTYTQLDVAYKRLDTGKIEGKKIMSFTNKDVFSTLSKATTGNIFDVTTEKVGEYWQWIEVSAASGGSAASDAPQAKSFSSPAPKSTYETAEERAKRQILIVRQSSLAQAVDILSVNPGKDKLQLEEVLHLADKLVDWVFNNETSKPISMKLEDMEDDIPM